LTLRAATARARATGKEIRLFQEQYPAIGRNFIAHKSPARDKIYAEYIMKF
jgi:hypothetical protein